MKHERIIKKWHLLLLTAWFVICLSNTYYASNDLREYPEYEAVIAEYQEALDGYGELFEAGMMIQMGNT